MIFLDFHKERVRKKELAAGTLKNYYRTAKLLKLLAEKIYNEPLDLLNLRLVSKVKAYSIPLVKC